MWCFVLIGLLLHLFGVNAELIHVNLLFRHGARTPLNGSYPSDPYLNSTYPPYGLGTLTKLGKVQAFELGQQLRQRYDQFLGNHYSHKIFQLYANDFVRVQETALAAMAALWPPTKDDAFIELDWQPVSYEMLNYKDKKTDPEYVPYDHVFNLPEFRARMNAYNETIIRAIMLNGRFDDVEIIKEVFSSVMAQNVLGLELPLWTKRIFPEPLSSLCYIIHTAPVFTKELRKTGCQVIKDWVSNIDNFFQKTEEPRAKFYAGHDSTIIRMLECLDIFHPPHPNYVSNIAIELHKNETDHKYVKVVYQAEHDQPTEILTIPGCDAECPLSQFKSIVQARTT